ncbi:hypothetical protein QR680_002854 [Steinernema hermaphroditum]|uniref:Uncharacterized protein n=1 Tax=Steinernema hermaphroditum TaxID=289476 RepID=A0AA39H6G4_9BILA|nr:hypothetical protein QR680_002854 [Steinernema hermaphroditum]
MKRTLDQTYGREDDLIQAVQSSVKVAYSNEPAIPGEEVSFVIPTLRSQANARNAFERLFQPRSSQVQSPRRSQSQTNRPTSETPSRKLKRNSTTDMKTFDKPIAGVSQPSSSASLSQKHSACPFIAKLEFHDLFEEMDDTSKRLYKAAGKNQATNVIKQKTKPLYEEMLTDERRKFLVWGGVLQDNETEEAAGTNPGGSKRNDDISRVDDYKKFGIWD